MSKIPYDRAKTIAGYLGISVESILSGEEIKIAPTETSERKYSDDEIMFALSRGGEAEITDEMFEEVKRFARFIAEQKEAKRKMDEK